LNRGAKLDKLEQDTYYEYKKFMKIPSLMETFKISYEEAITMYIDGGFND
jgi:archaellum biogenesis protein FlaJ (TadC family)